MCSTKPGTVHLRVDGTLDYLSIILVFSSLQTPMGQEPSHLVHGCVPAIGHLSGSQRYPMCLLSMNEDFCVPREWS